ncbi:MAG: flagellar hook-length control protein FliK [Hyphomicrobium sp.]
MAARRSLLQSPASETDAQLSPEDGNARTSIDLVLDSLSSGDPQPSNDAQSDEAPTSAPPAVPLAAQVNDIIGAAALAAAYAPPRETGNAATPAVQAKRTEDPATATIAILEQKAAATPMPDGETTAGAAPDQSVARQSLAAATDPTVASLSTRAAGAETGKHARKRETIDAPAQPPDAPVAAIEPDDVAPPAASQRPAASVRRQEAHFAPVTPSGSHPSSEQAGGIGPETPDAQSANAPATDSVTPSFEDLASSGNRPAQQIAYHILTEAGSGAEFAERTETMPAQPGMKSVLKILHIQLQPADLGTVTVRMELKDAELSLQVEADRPDTAELIRNDQDTLSKLLRSAGYSVDPSSVRVAEVDRTAASQQSGQGGAQTSFQSSPQSQSGASERQDHPQRGSGGANGGGTGQQISRNDTHETTTHRAGRGLYL